MRTRSNTMTPSCWSNRKKCWQNKMNFNAWIWSQHICMIWQKIILVIWVNDVAIYENKEVFNVFQIIQIWCIIHLSFQKLIWYTICMKIVDIWYAAGLIFGRNLYEKTMQATHHCRAIGCPLCVFRECQPRNIFTVYPSAGAGLAGLTLGWTLTNSTNFVVFFNVAILMDFIHILQGYFIGTGKMLRLSRYRGWKPERYGYTNDTIRWDQMIWQQKAKQPNMRLP